MVGGAAASCRATWSRKRRSSTAGSTVNRRRAHRGPCGSPPPSVVRRQTGGERRAPAGRRARSFLEVGSSGRSSLNLITRSPRGSCERAAGGWLAGSAGADGCGRARWWLAHRE
eukprot:258554-Prymnesium_polylepis.1